MIHVNDTAGHVHLSARLSCMNKLYFLFLNSFIADVHTMIDSSCNIINDFYSKVEKLEIE